MDKQYGVLHEIGDYSAPRTLSEEDNKTVNEQVNSSTQQENTTDK